MRVRYFSSAAAGAGFGLLFVFMSGMFAETSLRWMMALLALIGGAKLGALACYLLDMAVGNAPDINRRYQ